MRCLSFQCIAVRDSWRVACGKGTPTRSRRNQPFWRRDVLRDRSPVPVRWARWGGSCTAAPEQSPQEWQCNCHPNEPATSTSPRPILPKPAIFTPSCLQVPLAVPPFERFVAAALDSENRATRMRRRGKNPVRSLLPGSPRLDRHCRRTWNPLPNNKHFPPRGKSVVEFRGFQPPNVG